MSQTEIQSPMPQPSKVRPVLFSLLILVSGIIIGAGGVLIITNSEPPNNIPPSPEYMSRRMIAHLVGELNLTPRQQEQLQPVVEKHMETIDKYRDEARPKIRLELDQMNAEIMSLLDENQKQIWNDRIKRMQEHFSRPRQRRGSEGQEPRRFRERIPGQMPPPPDGPRRFDRLRPSQPQEPNLPTAQTPI